MGDVIRANFITKLDIAVETVLEGAAEANLREVIVLGRQADGGVEYFGSSLARTAEVILLLRRLEHRLLNEEFGPLERDDQNR
jgi:hypothetical protein